MILKLDAPITGLYLQEKQKKRRKTDKLALISLIYDYTLEEVQQLLFDQLPALPSQQALKASSLIGRTILIHDNRICRLKDEEVSTVILEISDDVDSLELVLTTHQNKKIKTISLSALGAGIYEFSWNGLNEKEESMPLGVYHLKNKVAKEKKQRTVPMMVVVNVNSVRFDTLKQTVFLNLAGVGILTLSQSENSARVYGVSESI